MLENWDKKWIEYDFGMDFEVKEKKTGIKCLMQLCIEDADGV